MTKNKQNSSYELGRKFVHITLNYYSNSLFALVRKQGEEKLLQKTVAWVLHGKIFY